MSAPDRGDFPDTVAVVVARDGRLPVGADEAVAEAGGAVVVVGSKVTAAAADLRAARRVWHLETGEGVGPGALAAGLAGRLDPVSAIIMPATPDGRDLAPRLAAALGRPLIAGAVRVECMPALGDFDPAVRAEVSRLDDRVLVPVTVAGPVVVTLVPRGVEVELPGPAAVVTPLPAAVAPPGGAVPPAVADPEFVALLEPDPRTMDLADATRVLAGGAGLAAGADDDRARGIFDLLIQVAAAMGGSAGATRVATDAGWAGYERQIGTTGVAVDPDLYIAFGISGATQHTGGLRTPAHIVSINTDASAPMTALADLGLVTDARGLLIELARRFGVEVPPALLGVAGAVPHGPSRGDDA